MAAKKWFGIAAVLAAIGGAVAFVMTKVKESPEKAAEVFESVKERVQGSGDADTESASEMESSAT